MTTVLEGGEGSASRRGRSLPPGKTRYPKYIAKLYFKYLSFRLSKRKTDWGTFAYIWH